jgi:hypothetical protein
MDFVAAALAVEGEDDDELLLAAINMLQSNAQWFMSEVLLDGRVDAVKEHERVIPSDWWGKIDSIQHDLSGEFKRTFRMSRKCFNHLVDYVDSKWIEVKGKHSYTCASYYDGGIRKKVAIAIHILSLECAVRVTAQQFGVNVSAAWTDLNDFLSIISKFSQDFIQLRRDFENIAEEFEQVASFPDVYGAVDGSHVLLNRPESWQGIYNRKGVPSLNCQAVVDA